jgi:hypothetical protein
MNVRAFKSQPAITSMKTPRLLVLLLACFFALLTPRPAEARVEVSFDFFYDSLAPYGEWVQVADYGYCWRPTDVDRDWAPYSDGYWAFTDAGWTWVSYEDFGGIVYHYGRWVRVEDEGWCWVPDYEWAPAWVSWRQSEDYVGWAPLPPEARWQPSVGISIWVDRVCDIGPANYNFCRVRDFGAPVLRPVIINRRDNVTIIRRTVNITNITYNTGYGDGAVIYNGGLNFASINQRTSRPVPALKLVQSGNADLPGARGWDRDRGDRGERRHTFNPQAQGNQLVVTAPNVRPPTDAGFLKSKISKVFAADQVTRGWSGVKNEEIRRELKQEMQRQTKGLTPETAPARPMAAADLQVVPRQADPQAASPTATRGPRDRKDRAPEAAGQPIPPTTVATVPPNTPPATDDQKSAREKSRGPTSRESQKPAPGAADLKPFNPVAETERQAQRGQPPATPPTVLPGVVKPAEDPVRMRDAERQKAAVEQQRNAETQRQQEQAAGRQKMQAEQENAARQQAEAAARQQQQMEIQRQKEQTAGAERQRRQAEQERAGHQQAEAAAAQQKQAEAQRAAQEAARNQAAERARQPQEQQPELRRRPQPESQGAEQQRRQLMEQQRAGQDAQRQQAERAAGEQRAQRERGEAAEQARRAQDGQREQMRQQMEAQRQQREAQRAVPPPANQPPSATPENGKRHRGDKEKDKDN